MSDLPAPPPAPKLWTAKLTRQVEYPYLADMYVTDIVSYELAEGIWFMKTTNDHVCAVPIANYLTVEIYPQEEES